MYSKYRKFQVDSDVLGKLLNVNGYCDLKLAILISYTHHIHITLYVQYVFMFQWPKLPEIGFSLVDYRALKDCQTYGMITLYMYKPRSA